MFSGRLAGHIDILFMVLFPAFLLKCIFIAYTDVVLISDYVVGKRVKFSLGNVGCSTLGGWGRSGVGLFLLSFIPVGWGR
jgi:hypothetical protein